MFDEYVVERPAWVEALVEVVREAVQPLGFIGHLGYRLWEPGSVYNIFDGWMLAVFPTANEFSGGPDDGAHVVSGFRLDISHLTEVFSEVENLSWSAPAQYNEYLDGPEIVVQGTVLGKHVLLRVYSLPPPDEPVTYVIDPLKDQAWLRRVEDAG